MNTMELTVLKKKSPKRKDMEKEYGVFVIKEFLQGPWTVFLVEGGDEALRRLWHDNENLEGIFA